MTGLAYYEDEGDDGEESRFPVFFLGCTCIHPETDHGWDGCEATDPDRQGEDCPCMGWLTE